MLIITTPMIEGKKAVVCEDEQQRETMETHVNVIAILWVISGIFGLFGLSSALKEELFILD